MKRRQFWSVVPQRVRFVACAIVCVAVLVGLAVGFRAGFDTGQLPIWSQPIAGAGIGLFAGSLVVENPGAEARQALVLKEEGDPDCVESVWINQTRVAFSVEDGQLRFRLTTLPGETAIVRVAYRNDLEAIPDRDSSGTHIKVAAKRYLSEFRDNYLSRNDFLYQSANRLKHLVR